MLAYYMRWCVASKRNEGDGFVRNRRFPFLTSQRTYLFAEKKPQTNTINLLGKLKRLLRSYYDTQGVGG